MIWIRLAASIAAEEDERLTNVASTSNASPSDEDDGIEEMIFVRFSV